MNDQPISAENVRSFVLASSSDEIETNLPSIGESLGLHGVSEAMRDVVRDVCRVAPTEVSVLIIGESGTGKDVVARALHELSPRRHRPLVIVNSGAIAEGILESELFGHERGAFTGAVSERKGYFETANGGTVFLDEIGEMPLSTQVKLLRVLETGEFLKVGGSSARKADVRVLAATNRHLEQMVRRGEFRKDLYYRLKAITLRLPPLRSRREDIPVLVEKFVSDFTQHTHAAFQGFTPEAMDRIVQYRWPGNVRELRNFVESVITLKRSETVTEEDVQNNILNFKDVDELDTDDGLDRHLPVPTHVSPEQAERELLYRTLLSLKQDVTDIKHFLAAQFGGAKLRSAEVRAPSEAYEGKVRSGKVVETEVYNVDDGLNDREMTLNEAERDLIIRALKKFDGKRSLAAKSLGLSERTLYRKIKQYHLDL